MSECQCQGVEHFFSGRISERELKQYRRNGPDKTTGILLQLLKQQSIQNASLLDIGGGVRVIQHELFQQGISRATHVDASTAYLRAARQHAERSGTAGNTTYLYGDFVEKAAEISEHDIVTLDKVICCYDNMSALVERSCQKSRHLYGIVLPRYQWWNRVGVRFLNAGMWVMRQQFRAFVHSVPAVEHILEQHRFQKIDQSHTVIWKIALYEKR